MKKSIIVLCSILLVASVSAATKEKKTPQKPKQAEKVEEKLIPPMFQPLPIPTSTTCGHVEHFGIKVFMVRSSDLNTMIGNVPAFITEAVEECVIKGKENLLSLALPEMQIAEFEYDSIICSVQKVFSTIKTYTATSLTWKYLHPARIHACFERMHAEYEKKQNEKQEKMPTEPKIKSGTEST